MRERRTEDAEENQEDGRRRQTHENGGETHIVYLWRGIHSISMAITRDPKEPVLLIAIKIMRHAKLCLLVIMFLICVCWHPERCARYCLLVGRGGKFDFLLRV